MNKFLLFLLLGLVGCGKSEKTTQVKYSSSNFRPVGVEYPTGKKFCTDKEEKKLVAAGEALFRQECARCHSPRLENKLIGPPLLNLSERMDDEGISRSDLYRWMRNSVKEMDIDPYFQQLFKEYNQFVMPPYPHLTDEDFDGIMKFIECYSLNFQP